MRPFVVDCQTAQEVRQLARAVVARRRAKERELQRKNPPPPAPIPPPAPAQLRPPNDVEIAAWILRHRAQTRELLREANEQLSRMPEPPRMSEIITAVCRHFGVSRVDLLSQRQYRALSHPRAVAMLLCRILTYHSLPQIGRFCGGRDHSTVLHAVRKLGWLKHKLEAELTADDPVNLWALRAHRHFAEKLMAG